ncbi:hypothetical protein SAMN02910369_01720 [Lachnospiraceae bacterium NE2001]|nr:hypothetical protein SAMN02910369_01720 [Lachnospiraceae bacterium NE2001]
MMKKMIIIGGGAAGMMTAIKASDRYSVTVIEKNDRPGKKLYITGKGRCNVTNDSDEETFLKNVVTNPKFLYSAIYSYNQSAVITDFESWGVRLKTERGNRVFPESDHSSDIIKALRQQLEKRKIEVIYNSEVVDIITEEYESDESSKEKYLRQATGVLVHDLNKRNAGTYQLSADVIVIATGGCSYEATGSTGDGYDYIYKINALLPDSDSFIAVEPRRPSLVPIETKEKFVKGMMGLSLKNVSLKVIASKSAYNLKKDKIIYEELGEMLFTHFGVSGPLCLSASSYISSFAAKELAKHNNEFDYGGLTLEIDLKPGLSEEDLDRRLLRDFEEYHNRDFQNSLGKLLPRLLIPVIIDKSGIKPEKKVNSITAEERAKLLQVLKHFTLTVKKLRGFDEAIITGGGISVKEINPQNMELKKVKNLRAAGEVIDCDALTGGFNLQIAWSTAYLAAE